VDWLNGHFRLFVSHVSGNKQVASELAAHLRDRHKIHGFVAHEDIVPTSAWQISIENALKTMDALVAIHSPGFAISTWCNQEVGWALGSGKLVLSVRAGEDPQGLAGRFQAVAYRNDNTVQLSRDIDEVLRRHEKTFERASEVLADRFLAAFSWEELRETLLPILVDTERMSPVATATLRRALVENSHLPSLRERAAVEQKLSILEAAHSPNHPSN
jgi:hypothetical protein